MARGCIRAKRPPSAQVSISLSPRVLQWGGRGRRRPWGRALPRNPLPAPQPALFQAAMQGYAKEGRTFYTPFRAEVLGSISAGGPDQLWNGNKNDPWDGRVSREEAFRAHLKEVAPQSEIKDLDPIINELRGIKSPREIAVIREATRIAGLGIMEAMRDAKPGLYEYELQADSEFVFKNTVHLALSVLCPDRHGTEHLLHALPPQHSQAERRRPVAVRLRAGL